MSSGFDTKKFIQEIEKWPQLWSSRHKSSRDEQYLAWHNVGEVLFSNWKLCPVEIREERVREMRTLWRNIQEKYFQEISNTKFRTKRENKYIKLLDFLKRDTQRLIGKGSSVRKKKHTRSKKKKEEIAQKVEDVDEYLSEEDGDESFFRSLLPTVRNLNELQRMNFRLDILNSIKKIMLESSNSGRQRNSGIKPVREPRAKEAQ